MATGQCEGIGRLAVFTFYSARNLFDKPPAEYGKEPPMDKLVSECKKAPLEKALLGEELNERPAQKSVDLCLLGFRETFVFRLAKL